MGNITVNPITILIALGIANAIILLVERERVRWRCLLLIDGVVALLILLGILVHA